jgi:tetratricopeptide (TPR) repeat protein
MLLARLASRLEADPSPVVRAQAAEEALELVKSLEDPGAITEVLWACHDATSGPDNLAERLRISADLVRWGQQLPERIPVAAGHLRRFAALLEDGRRTDAEHELTLLSRVAEGRQMPSHTRSLRTCRAALMVMSGEFDAAERIATENLAAGQAYDPDATAIFGAQLFSIRWLQGRAGELMQLIQGALEPAPSFLPWRAALGVMHASVGARGAASAEFEGFAADAFSIVPRTRYWTVMMVMLTEVCTYLQDEVRAGLLYELLLPFRERTGVGGLGHVCTGSNERALGVLAATMKRWDEAEEHFERALSANRALRALPWIARTLDGYADMLLARGAPKDAARARSAIEDANAIAGDLGIRRAQAAPVRGTVSP